MPNPKYRWRTAERIAKVTALKQSEVDSVLSELMARDFVRPSISKNKRVIFGLTERVGER